MLILLLFGAFETTLNSAPLESRHRRESDKLLALLALQRGQAIENAVVAQRLWPETCSLDSLRQSVSHLRSLLGEERHRLETERNVIRFALHDMEVDVLQFEAHLAEQTEEGLQKAVLRYRGHLLSSWEAPWIKEERERQKERCLHALKRLGGIHLQREQFDGASNYFKRALNLKPNEMALWKIYMQSLMGAKEYLLAKEVYLRYRDHLHQKHQLSPPVEMTQWYREIEQDQRLPALETGVAECIAETVGGAVPLDSPFYIERPVDKMFHAAIAKHASVVLIKGPRQTGKTSLLARSLQQERQRGFRVAFTDFQRLDMDAWESVESFYIRLAENLATQLNAPPPSLTWKANRGANDNFDAYMRDATLMASDSPLVWGMDEVDKLFPCSFSNQVFALFRAWHNERALDPNCPWKRLTLAISYATEAFMFISDLNQSPFNIGVRLSMNDFQLSEAEEMNARYGHPLKTDGELRQFCDFVGRSPYLVRRGLQEMVLQNWSFAQFEKQASLPHSCYRDHLQRLAYAISKDPALQATVHILLQKGALVDEASFYRLSSAGVLQGETPLEASFRCRLYEIYLRKQL